MTEPKPGARVEWNGIGPTFRAMAHFAEELSKLKPDADTVEQQAACLAFVCRVIDGDREKRFVFERDVVARLEKLEALNPDAHTIVGVTTSGATVHGLRKEPSE